jgi:hypothetical protein
MGGMFSKKQDQPQAAPPAAPPAPPPTGIASSQPYDAAAQGKGGLSSTVLTGAGGLLGSGETTKKQLLGS